MAKNKKKSKSKQKKNANITRWSIPNPLIQDQHPNTLLSEPHLPYLCVRFAKKQNMMQRNASYDAKSLENDAVKYYEEIAKLSVDYNEALAELPDAIPMSEIENKNIIDLSNIQNDAYGYTTDVIRAYIKSLTDAGSLLPAAVPCFESGVIICPPKEENNQKDHIIFSVENIDPEQNALTINIKLCQHLDFLPDVLVPITEMNLTITIMELQKDEIITYSIKCNNAPIATHMDVLTKVPPSQLPWSELQKQAWRDIVLQNRSDVEQTNPEYVDGWITTQADNLVWAITMTNAMLSSGRLTLVKEPKTSQNHSSAPSASETPARRVRTVGPVRFVSPRPPKAPTKQTIRRYVTPFWHVRGHTRTYKSGKTVYIRPNTFHRKGMEDSTPISIPTTLRVKNNTEF